MWVKVPITCLIVFAARSYGCSTQDDTTFAYSYAWRQEYLHHMENFHPPDSMEIHHREHQHQINISHDRRVLTRLDVNTTILITGGATLNSTMDTYQKLYQTEIIRIPQSWPCSMKHRPKIDVGPNFPRYTAGGFGAYISYVNNSPPFILVCGTQRQNCFKLENNSRTWVHLNSTMLKERQYARATWTPDGFLWVTGGKGSGDSSEILSDSGQWIEGPAMPDFGNESTGIYKHAIVQVDEKIHLLTGGITSEDSDEGTTTSMLYYWTNHTWVEFSPLLHPRHSHLAFKDYFNKSRSIIVAGGEHQGKLLNDSDMGEIWDISEFNLNFTTVNGSNPHANTTTPTPEPTVHLETTVRLILPDPNVTDGSESDEDNNGTDKHVSWVKAVALGVAFSQGSPVDNSVVKLQGTDGRPIFFAGVTLNGTHWAWDVMVYVEKDNSLKLLEVKMKHRRKNGIAVQVPHSFVLN